MLRGDCQTGNGVNQAKDEMTTCQITNIDHRLSQTRLDNSVAHADDKKKEERE